MPSWLLHIPEARNTWDEDLLVLDGHLVGVIAIEFSQDGKYLATCSGDNIIRVWETTAGECTTVLFNETCRHNLVTVTFSSSNRRLAAAFVDHDFDEPRMAFSVIIYDHESGTVLRTLDSGQFWRPSKMLGLLDIEQIRLAFMPESDDTLLAVVLESGMLEVWRAEIQSNDFKQLWCTNTLNGVKYVHGYANQGLAISPDVSRVLCSLPCRTCVASWQIDSGSPSSTYSLEEPIESFLTLRGTNLIYETASRGMEILRRSDTHSRPAEIFARGERSGTRFAVSHASDKIAYSSGRIAAEMRRMPCNSDSKSEVQSQALPSRVEVAFDGESILVEYPNHLELLDTGGNLVFETPAYESQMFVSSACKASISNDGNVIVARLKGETHLWYGKLKRLQKLPERDSYAIALPVISNNGRSIVFCSEGRLCLWDLERNQEGQSIKMAPVQYSSTRWIRFSQDDQILQTNVGDYDIRTCQWKPPEGVHPPFIDEDELRLTGLNDDHEWVQFHNEDLIWLPPRCRPLRNSFNNFHNGRNTVAIGCQKGRVVVLKFVDACIP